MAGANNQFTGMSYDAAGNLLNDGAPPNTIFIFTCNGTAGLEPRFLSRCRTVEFSSYGMASEIAAFLDRVWHSEGGNGNGPDLSRVVKDSRNNVRDALMTLEVELMAL